MPQTQPKKTIITDEGELRDVPAEERLSSVYCTQCGSANPQSSHFCRNCGHALDDLGPDPDYQPLRKPKHAEQVQPVVNPSTNAWPKVIVELFTLIIVGGMSITAMALGSAWLVVVFVIAWFMVEMARNGVLK